jgi:hypothetical protein
MPNQKRLTLVKKNKQGSALVFALIILSMMLTVAMSLSTAAVMQKKSASSTQFSIQAYQVADSGAQLALQIINQKITSLNIEQRRVLGAFNNCSEGVVVFTGGNLPANTTLHISFFKATNEQVACNELIDTVASIHATAQHLNTVRAVELAVSKEASPIAWWKLDDNTGTTATDSSGNSFDGTLTNFPGLTSPWTTTGRLLGALNFDGSDDYVNTSFNPFSSLGQSFTIESWVYPTDANNYRGIWGAHGAIASTGIVLQHNRGQWIASVGDGSVWHEIELGTFELNKWTHVAIVFEGSPAGSDGFLKGYINGGSGSSGGRTITTTISSLQVAHDPSFWIGRGHSDANSRYFKGTIDDVKIFDYALSGLEIYNDYRDGFFNCVGNLITGGSYYPGDETDPPENLNPVYDPIGTARKCEFFCSDYFNWHAPECLTAVCTGLPTNAIGFSLPDSAPLKDKAYTYSVSDNDATTCEFKCNPDYVYYATANTCNTCTGSVPGHATMYANDKAGLSVDTPYIRSGSNTSANCEFECDDYYNWNGNNCDNAAVCTGLPAGATAFLDAGNATPLKDLAYTFSSSYTSGAKCKFACNSGLSYDSATNTCKTPAPTSVDYLVVAGGGGGGMDMGGGGGGGGVREGLNYSISANQIYGITVGAGGSGAPAAGTNGQPAGHQYTVPARNGQDSAFASIVAVGGGYGGSSANTYAPGSSGFAGGSGGGASGYNNNYNTAWIWCATEGGTCSFTGVHNVKYCYGSYCAYRYGINTSIGCNNAEFGDPRRGKVKSCYYFQINNRNAFGGAGTSGQGNIGGNQGDQYYSGGGGGAGGAGASGNGQANGGVGYQSSITGSNFYWGGGGGGAGHSITGGNGGAGGGGGGAVGATSGGAGLNNGQAGGGGAINSWANAPGGNAGANTGGGGGGGSHYNANNKGGDGGSGIVVIRYLDIYRDATTTGSVTYSHVGSYKIYTWTSSGSISF